MLGLTADQRERLQSDPDFIPNPHVDEELSHPFSLPLGHKIL